MMPVCGVAAPGKLLMPPNDNQTSPPVASVSPLAPSKLTMLALPD